MKSWKTNHANIKEWAANYEGELFDGILCDPPYELGFMGKSWDSSGIAFDVDMWKDVYKLLKPGGHLLAFSGSRTYHRMAVAIEDAGFEIRDQIMWVYGSGFPKSLNIGKAVDKLQGNEREVVGKKIGGTPKTGLYEAGLGVNEGKYINITKGTSLYEGYGTALKPAHEPCVLARKPLEKGHTVATNALKHGTGGLNIDGTRVKPDYYLQGSDLNSIISLCQLNHLLLPVNSVELKRFQDDTTNAIKSLFSVLETADMPTTEKIPGTQQVDTTKKATSCSDETSTANTNTSSSISGSGNANMAKNQTDTRYITSTVSKMITDWKISSSLVSRLTEVLLTQAKKLKTTNGVQGRFPSNLIHDGSDEVEAVFPQTKAGVAVRRNKGIVASKNVTFNANDPTNTEDVGYDDSGSASRFFYCAKASKSERNAGLEGFEEKITNDGRKTDIDNAFQRGITERKNHHPTVKPLSLTKYLATLIKPPTGGRLLVPFSGSGSEMIGALQAGWEYVEGVELTEEYIPIAEARIEYWLKQMNKQTEIF